MKIKWTESAEKELNNYLERVRGSLGDGSVDCDEVIDDLRRHIDTEISEMGLNIVAVDDIRQILARMGSPGKDEQAPEKRVQIEEKNPRKIKKAMQVIGMGSVVAFGIVLPLVALGVEITTQMCAGVFFNPIPTIGHILFYASIPAANIIICYALWSGNINSKTLGRLNGAAIGVSLVYTILFLPITPLGVMAIPAMGIGLLALSPILSLSVSLAFRSKLKKALALNHKLPMPRPWRPILTAFALFCALSAQQAITQTGMIMAAGDNPATRVRGIKILRKFGDEEALLRNCYAWREGDTLSFLFAFISDPIAPEEAKKIYYRVTGTPYNAAIPPELRGLRGGYATDAAEFDFEQGGDEVAARLRDLYLTQSRIDSRVDAFSGVSYTEWTMVFQNDHPSQREARARVHLPPGAVVSRVTLWIDGEEREAAYGGRSQVKTAYRQVVQQRRDPLLVTTCGPDQVLLQCFPVPPDGGTMKIKIGITAPLALASEKQQLLRLPSFTERNFIVKDDFSHSVWIEGENALTVLSKANDLMSEQPSEQLFALRGELTDAQLTKAYTVSVDRNQKFNEAWTKNQRFGDDAVIRQFIREKTVSPPDYITIVIDGSRRMEEHASVLADALLQLPGNSEFSILHASDEVVELNGFLEATMENKKKAAEMTAELEYAGGCDNTQALIKAWDAAASKPKSAIVWLHAPQPVLFQGEMEKLLQRFERRPGNPALYDLQFGNGVNKIGEALSKYAAVKTIPDLGNAAAALNRQLALWSGTEKSLCYERIKVENGDAAGREGSSHIARLWAFEEIKKLARSDAEEDRAKAIELAKTYQLVTPVSGAVVLESKEQYDEAGLDPSSKDSAPGVVPEPQTFILFGTGLVLLALIKRRWNTVH